MPWTIDNPPNPARHASKHLKEVCVAAANSTLKRTNNEEKAIQACIGAMKNVARKNYGFKEKEIKNNLNQEKENKNPIKRQTNQREKTKSFINALQALLIGKSKGISNAQQMNSDEHLKEILNLVNTEIKKQLPVLKSLDDEKRLITGVVLEPEIVDAQGDIIGSEEIEKACFDYMTQSQKVGLQHKFVGPVSVVENWIAKNDCFLDQQFIKKGTWLMTVKVEESEAGNKVWELAKSGKLTGFSIGGTAEVEEETQE